MFDVATVGDVEALAGVVHVGRRDHYSLARDLVARRPDRAVLMQRSSTLLLGPEAGWDEEAGFHDELWRSIEHGTVWFHIVSLRGIRRHLLRRSSVFPHVPAARARLRTEGGIVSIPVAGRVGQPIRTFPDEHTGLLGEDFKFDRQARLVLTDFGGDVEALVVSDIGDQQCTIHLAGPQTGRLLDLCLSCYERCRALTTIDLDNCFRGNSLGEREGCLP